MGFRNPITSLNGVTVTGVVQTAPPGNAGARLINMDVPNAAGEVGALVLDDGLGMDQYHQALVYSMPYDPFLTGSGSSTARTTVVQGGSYDGHDAPVLWLIVEPDGAGGYHRRLRFSADVLELDSAQVTLLSAQGTAGGSVVRRDYVDGQRKTGSFSGSSDATGRVTVAHNLGTVPSFVAFTSQVLGAFDTTVFALVSVSSTQFVAQVYYNNTLLKSTNGVAFIWSAWK